MQRAKEEYKATGFKVGAFMRQHSPLTTIFIYLLLTALVTAVLVWRFPNNVTHANFYAEDGSVFLQNILDKGWLHAAITPFNGYFVVGIYVICGLGWLLNLVFGGLGLLSLPSYFALASIIFMSSVISLPYLLFRKVLGSYKTLLVIAFSALLPLPLSPHVVIGTVGNQKWIFMYLAFLLVAYRIVNIHKLSTKKLILIDGSLLVSAYTNSTVYLLFPILLLPYAKELWVKNRNGHNFKKTLRDLLRRKEVLSSIVLGAALVPQAIYVLINGIPKIAGYLDTPFQMSKLVEVFINRTYLFGVTHFINGYMGNLVAIILFLALLAIGFWLVKGSQRTIFWLGIYSAGVASLLFVINRPGVSEFFFGYQASGSGPDQFFYAQTLIMYVPIVIGAFAVAAKMPKNRLGVLLLSVFSVIVILAGVYSNHAYGARWRNASVFENSTGTFMDQAIGQCQNLSDRYLNLPAYPSKEAGFVVHADRSKVCSQKVYGYGLSVQDLGLMPYNNDYETINKSTRLLQTFKAEGNHLNGIRVFISTFNNYDRRGEYSLVLYDASCHKQLRKAPIPQVLLDNSYYNARFSPISNSALKTYCFTIAPPTGKFDPIAVQKSRLGIYQQGNLIENGKKAPNDVVFAPLYPQGSL